MRRLSTQAIARDADFSDAVAIKEQQFFDRLKVTRSLKPHSWHDAFILLDVIKANPSRPRKKNKGKKLI